MSYDTLKNMSDSQLKKVLITAKIELGMDGIASALYEVLDPFQRRFLSEQLLNQGLQDVFAEENEIDTI